MPTYIVQGRYSAEGLRGMIAKPEDRAEQVRALMSKAGAKMTHYYVTLGEYDFLTIAEAPSNKEIDMIASLLTAAASGGVASLKTTTAITSAQAKTAFEKAKTMRKGFRGAGMKKS